MIIAPTLLLLLTLPASPASTNLDDARRIATLAIASSSISSLAIADISREENAIRIRLRGHFEPFDEVAEDLLLEAFAGSHLASSLGVPLFLDVTLKNGGVRELGGSPQLRHSDENRRRPTPPTNALASPNKDRMTDRFPFGSALLGRRIAISAGHGWLPNGAGWRTQRDRWTGCSGCRGIIEDFFTQELVSRQVLPLLQNMGAEIVLVREPNLRADIPSVVVDDGDSAYSEQGSWATGTGADGWAGDYRTNADTDLGQATFSLPISQSQPIRVALRFREGANRTSAAIVNVNHQGGTRTLNIDQTKMGRHWLDLGAYVMGSAGSVEIAHGPAAGFLVADAVKAGGGIWEASEKPFWQMSAQEWVPYNGAPSDVLSRSDVTIRPAFAETANPDLYLSIHANAAGVTGGSSANGISTYRYSCGTYANFTSSANASACDDPPGSTNLIDDVHGALVASLRGEWDADFGNRGKLVANFGEIRELDDTPGILIETGFFDNTVDPAGSPPPAVNDNTALHDPRWREAFARGLAEGVAQYLTGGHVPPARPLGVSAKNQNDGTVVVSWRPATGALGYRVYRATSGRAFDEGTIVEGQTSLVVTDGTPRDVMVFKVASLDDNGEGFASTAVGLRFRGASLTGPAASGLLVTAYDRWDARVQDQDNDLQYAVELAHAFGATDRDFYFDGVSDEVVDDDANALDGYEVVLWNTGKDSTFHKPFSNAARDKIRLHHERGGSVFASGEEIGWALVSTSDDPEDEAFLADVFGATFAADDAATFSAFPVAGGIFGNLGDVLFDDGSGGVYEVKFPDAFSAIADAEVGLQYPDGTGAAIVSSGGIIFGFPLETVVPDVERARVARQIINTLVPGLGANDLDNDGASDACEQDFGFDWRGDDDGNEASAACEGVPFDGGAPDEDAGASEDGGADEDGGSEPDGGGQDPEPAQPTPEPGAEPLDRFRIAPEPTCGCASTSNASLNAKDGGSAASIFAVLLLAALSRRRRSFK